MASTSWTPAYTLAVSGFGPEIIDSTNGYVGMQEETTALGVPCLTLRNNTERPINVEQNTNLAVDRDTETIRWNADAILPGHGKAEGVSEL